jgi:hypothetical protein
MLSHRPGITKVDSLRRRYQYLDDMRRFELDADEARIGGFLASTHSSQALFISAFRFMSAM